MRPEGPGDALSTAARADLERALRIVRVLTAALSLGVAVLAGVVVFLAGGELAVADGPPLDPGLLPSAGGAGILLLGLAPVVGGRVASGGETRDEAVQSWLTGRILALALRDGVGVVGLAVGLLAGSVPWALGFAAASVASMALAWPRGDDLEDRLRRLSGV